MRIIHIVRGNYSTAAMNGVYCVIDQLSSELVSKGQDVTVCCIGNGQKSIQLDELPYSIIHFKEQLIPFFLSKKFKRFLAEEDKTTFFHFHSVFIPWFLPAVLFLRKTNHKNIILTPHGQYTDTPMSRSLKKRIFFSIFDRHVIENASLIHLIGVSEMNNFIVNNNSNVVLIPNGSPISNIREIELQDNDILIFGFLGRLDISQKGLDILIKEFLLYKAKGGAGKLLIAGGGKDKVYLNKMISESEFPESISIVGPLFGSEKLLFWKRISFFCHTSRWDVVPTSVLEAFSNYLPAIVTPATNMSKFVKDYDAGFVFDNSDETGSLCRIFFNAEELFFNNQQAYTSMRIRAMMVISKELNWKSISEIFMSKVYTIKLSSTKLD